MVRHKLCHWAWLAPKMVPRSRIWLDLHVFIIASVTVTVTITLTLTLIEDSRDPHAAVGPGAHEPRRRSGTRLILEQLFTAAAQWERGVSP